MNHPQTMKDVRCLNCKTVFMNVYPNKPSGRCSCNGYSKEVPWEWCNGDDVKKQNTNSSVEMTEGGTVNCPVCSVVNNIDNDLIEESMPLSFNCERCDSDLIVDPYVDIRITRNTKLWETHPGSAYHQPPDLSLPTDEFIHLFNEMKLLFYTQQGGQTSIDAYELIGA